MPRFTPKRHRRASRAGSSVASCPSGVAGAEQLLTDADALVEKSIWLIGGDGWAYDIGFGGLDHVLSLTENVNITVLDTQCYSNTGGRIESHTAGRRHEIW